MDCKACENWTADYLGGELDREHRTRFERHLLRCPLCRQRVDELAESIKVLELLESVPYNVAHARTRRLCVVRRRPAAVRVVVAMLKTAAILVLGVWLGRFTAPRTTGGPRPSRANPTVQMAGPAAVHPGWFKLARGVGSGASTLAGQLAIVVNSRR